MGRNKKRRRSHSETPVPRSSQRADPPSYDVEIVDDLGEALPHPLDDVAAALDRSADAGGDATQEHRAVDAAPRRGCAATPTDEPGPSPPDAIPEMAAETTHPTVHEVEAAAGSETPETRQARGREPVRNLQTLGELLQQAREARGLSLEETSARTCIAAKMLRHLESDRFGELPAEAYVKGFLRSYGSFLGLDIGMLLRRYASLSGRPLDPAPEIWEEVVVQPEKPRLWKRRRRTWTIAVAAALTAALVWVFWSRGASRMGLRPTDGLEQIENELRDAAADGRPGPPGPGADHSGAPAVRSTPGGTTSTAPSRVEDASPAPRRASTPPREDTAPPVPPQPADSTPAAGTPPRTAPAPRGENAQPPKPAVKPKKRRPTSEKKKKTRPAQTSPEHAAGPPR